MPQNTASRPQSLATIPKRLAEGQLKVNQEALLAGKKKHPAFKFRSRYDMKMDNWKDLDEAQVARELEELQNARNSSNQQPESGIARLVAKKLDYCDGTDTARSETSAHLLKQIGTKKEVAPNKAPKLKKAENFRISGLPRAISVQDLQAKPYSELNLDREWIGTSSTSLAKLADS